MSADISFCLHEYVYGKHIYIMKFYCADTEKDRLEKRLKYFEKSTDFV